MSAQRESNLFLSAKRVSCRRSARSATPSSRLRGVSLAVEQGSWLAICGGEKCGKNLLLRLLGLFEPFEKTDSGNIFLRGQPTRDLDKRARADLRNRHFGFVFSEPFLLEGFSVTENVAMPLFKIARASVDEARAATDQMLDLVRLHELAQANAASLSLLDQCKVALARALANKPEILIVEEIDAQLSGRELIDFVETIQRAKMQLGLTVVASTTACEAMPDADHVVQLVDGKIARDSSQSVSIAGGAQK